MVDTADIKKLAVDTLQIAGNAVTVPMAAVGSALYSSGEAVRTTVTLTQSGKVYAVFNASQGYNDHSHYVFRITITDSSGNSRSAEISGDAYNDAPTISLSKDCSVGDVIVKVDWISNGNMLLNWSNLYAIGTMK